MFKSIQFIQYFRKNNNLCALYQIVDDDFKEEYIIDSLGTERPIGSMSAAAIINCYSSRNLNVAHNLILFMQSLQKEYDYPILAQIYCYKKYSPGFEKYLPEINKYLNLL